MTNIGATGFVQMFVLQNAWEEDGLQIGCHPLRGARLGPPCSPMHFFPIFALLTMSTFRTLFHKETELLGVILQRCNFACTNVFGWLPRLVLQGPAWWDI